jgi:hypothetical protein
MASPRRPPPEGLPRPYAHSDLVASEPAIGGGCVKEAAPNGRITNPAREEGVKLKTRKPKRSYLESARQVTALLDAANERDAEAMRREPEENERLRALVQGLGIEAVPVPEPPRIAPNPIRSM